MAELGAAALASTLAQLQANARGTRRDRGPDFAHQLRVGARRARVVLRLWQKRIGKARARTLREELRWVFRVVGTVRDYDVLLARVIEPLTSDEVDPELELLAGELTRQRKRAQRSVKEALRSVRFEELQQALSQLADELGKQPEAKRARKWLARKLDLQREHVLSLRDALVSGDEPALHTLRKQLKSLRYAAELGRGLWRKKRVDHYLAQMKALQDALGGLNDAATGRALLAQARATTPGDLLAALALCEATLASEVLSLLPGLVPRFATFEDSEPFWH